MRANLFLPIIITTGAAARWLPSGQTPLLLLDDDDDTPGRHVCPLPAKVPPPADGFHSSLEFVQSEAVRQRQVDRLSRAVQVPSTSTELEDDPWSDYYAPFIELHEVLEDLFPLVYVYVYVSLFLFSPLYVSS